MSPRAIRIPPADADATASGLRVEQLTLTTCTAAVATATSSLRRVAARALTGALVVAALVATSRAGAPSASAQPQAPVAPAPYSIHEWGLFSVDANRPARATATTEVAPAPAPMMPVAHKPVIYVHLDPGVAEQAFDLRLGIPGSRVLERWPSEGSLGAAESRSSSGWLGVVARAGACDSASETPAPLAASRACTSTPDRFCEASEIPRYYGDRVSCLHTGAAATELLFYRTAGISARELPLRMVRVGTSWRARRVGDATIEGPVFWITSLGPWGPVNIRRLEPADFDTPLVADPSAVATTVAPEDVRAALLDEATRRGLSPGEAEAFVDAWAPAYFGSCSRNGPEASGAIPDAQRPARSSLLYFAPEERVDRMIPLTTSPPARETHRVFLVRWIDARTMIAAGPPGAPLRR